MLRPTLKAILLILLTLSVWALAQPVNAAPAIQTGCLFFTETSSQPGKGYTVCDDGDAQFRTAFQRFGLQQIGYPISQRYTRDGFVTQAFQKGIMQWRADTRTVALTNMFDDLSQADQDSVLFERYQTPIPFAERPSEGGLSFEQVVVRRQSLLNTYPALRRAYFASPDPITFFGLPTSEVQDMGNHYAIRTQRAVLQEWKQDVPWARAGQVTIANGGDIARTLGQLPAAALVPVSAPVAPPAAAPTAIAAPARLRIPGIGVNAAVEHVGLDAAGAVAVPQGAMNVAWFKLGAMPGAVGNANMVGHLDDATGPAVFWDLSRVRVGDEIIVEDANGNEYVFEVIDTQIYAYDDLTDMTRIYGRTSERNLNLTTCYGTWNAGQRNYDRRLVVYSRLKQ